MALLARVGAVAGPVQVQDQPVGPAPPRHRSERGEAHGEVHHHDHAADVAGELGPFVHLLHRCGRDVHVVALDLARGGRGAHHGLDREQVAVAPAHERLGVDVLVVLGEVEPAAERLEHHAAVVLRRQPELGLGGGAEQRAAELVQVLALHHHPVGRALERLHVVRRYPHVLEPERLERLEAEDVADDRRGEVRDRALLEQVEVVGDVGDVLSGRTGHWVHAVSLRLVVLVAREPIRPDHRPRGGGRLARHRRGRLDGLDALLRRDAEGGQHVGVLGLVVRVPVAHLRVRGDARGPAILRRCSVVGRHGSILSRRCSDGDPMSARLKDPAKYLCVRLRDFSKLCVRWRSRSRSSGASSQWSGPGPSRRPPTSSS